MSRRARPAQHTWRMGDTETSTLRTRAVHVPRARRHAGHDGRAAAARRRPTARPCCWAGTPTWPCAPHPVADGLLLHGHRLHRAADVTAPVGPWSPPRRSGRATTAGPSWSSSSCTHNGGRSTISVDEESLAHLLDRTDIATVDDLARPPLARPDRPLRPRLRPEELTMLDLDHPQRHDHRRHRPAPVRRRRRRPRRPPRQRRPPARRRRGRRRSSTPPARSWRPASSTRTPTTTPSCASTRTPTRPSSTASRPWSPATAR